MWKLLAFSILCCYGLRFAGCAPGDEVWNYTEVRPGAHMFWWLMFSRNSGAPASRPLVIWLTGGPGAASTGWGNFEEVGPQDWKLQKRNITWLDHSHLLFVDSPVGSGYSYVESNDLYCTTNLEIALDLVTMLKHVLTNVAPQLSNSPIFILGESYGGKMAPEFALELNKAIAAGQISANLKGVIMRDGWSSPDDGIATYAEYALQTGLVDRVGYNTIQADVRKVQNAVSAGQWAQSYGLFDNLLNTMTSTSHGVDLFYILNRTPPFISGYTEGLSRSARHEIEGELLDAVTLERLMNGVIRDKLVTTVPQLAVFDAQHLDVGRALEVDFMKPTTNIVERLLNQTGLKVAVVNGQLDWIVCTPGVLLWVERLSWPGSSSWKVAPRNPVIVGDVVEGYVKQQGALSLWWVNRAGHSTFYFNPQFGLHMLQQLTVVTSNTSACFPQPAFTITRDLMNYIED